MDGAGTPGTPSPASGTAAPPPGSGTSTGSGSARIRDSTPAGAAARTAAAAILAFELERPFAGGAASTDDSAAVRVQAVARALHVRSVLRSRAGGSMRAQLRDVLAMLREANAPGAGSFERQMEPGLRAQLRKQSADLVEMIGRPTPRETHKVLRSISPQKPKRAVAPVRPANAPKPSAAAPSAAPSGGLSPTAGVGVDGATVPKVAAPVGPIAPASVAPVLAAHTCAPPRTIRKGGADAVALGPERVQPSLSVRPVDTSARRGGRPNSGAGVGKGAFPASTVTVGNDGAHTHACSSASVGSSSGGESAQRRPCLKRRSVCQAEQTLDWTKVRSRVLSHSADYSRVRAAGAHAYAAGHQPTTSTGSPPNKRCVRPALDKGPALAHHASFALAFPTSRESDGGSAELNGQAHRPATHAQVLAAQAAGRVRTAGAEARARASDGGNGVAASSDGFGEEGGERAAHARKYPANLRHELAALIASDRGIASGHRADSEELTSLVVAAGTDVAHPAGWDAGARAVAGTGGCGGSPMRAVPAGAPLKELGQQEPGSLHDLGPVADAPCMGGSMCGGDLAGGESAWLSLSGGLTHGSAVRLAPADTNGEETVHFHFGGRFDRPTAAWAGKPPGTHTVNGSVWDGPDSWGDEDTAEYRHVLPSVAGFGGDAGAGQVDVAHDPGLASTGENDFPPGVSVPRLSPQPAPLLQAPDRDPNLAQPELHQGCLSAPGRPLPIPPRREDRVEPSQHSLGIQGASAAGCGSSDTKGSNPAVQARTHKPAILPARLGTEAAPVAVAGADASGALDGVPDVKRARGALSPTTAASELVPQLPQARVMLAHLERPAEVLDSRESSGQSASEASAEIKAQRNCGGGAQMAAEAAGAEAALTKGKFQTRADRERDLGHLGR